MMSAPGLAGAQATTPRMALRVIGVGMLAFVAASTGLALETPALLSGAWQSPHLLSLLHLALVGWVTLVAVGVLYQMLPVIQQVPLWGESTGHFVLAGLAAGTVGLSGGFWSLRVPWLIAGGTLVIAALALFLAAMAGTLRQVASWNLKGVYVANALLYLAVTVALGLVMALNFRFGFLGPATVRVLAIHAHLGVMGWLTLLIVGVSYQLVPMFGLAHGFSERPARMVLLLLNLGLLLLAGTMAAGGPRFAEALAAFLILAGVVLYVIDMGRIIHRRVRRQMDISLRYMLSSLAYLVTGAGVGTGLLFGLWPTGRASILYGYLVIAGWVGLVVIGMAHKIVPFLAWHVRFGARLGKEQVPLPNDLLSERLGLTVWGLWNIGVLGTALGIGAAWPLLAQVGSLGVALAAWLAVYNLALPLVSKGRAGEMPSTGFIQGGM